MKRIHEIEKDVRFCLDRVSSNTRSIKGLEKYIEKIDNKIVGKDPGQTYILKGLIDALQDISDDINGIG